MNYGPETLATRKCPHGLVSDDYCHQCERRVRTLTPTQRKILWLMNKHGPARFGRPAKYRVFRYGIDGRGLMIGAYASPEYFLKARGIIEACGDNNPGCFQLTDWGEELVRGLRPGPTRAVKP